MDKKRIEELAAQHAGGVLISRYAVGEMIRALQVRAALAQPAEPGGGDVDYPALAEAWCEVALNGLQWLRNISETHGIVADKALANMQECVDDLNNKQPVVFPPPLKRTDSAERSAQ